MLSGSSVNVSGSSEEYSAPYSLGSFGFWKGKHSADPAAWKQIRAKLIPFQIIIFLVIISAAGFVRFASQTLSAAIYRNNFDIFTVFRFQPSPFGRVLLLEELVLFPLFVTISTIAMGLVISRLFSRLAVTGDRNSCAALTAATYTAAITTVGRAWLVAWSIAGFMCLFRFPIGSGGLFLVNGASILIEAYALSKIGIYFAAIVLLNSLTRLGEYVPRRRYAFLFSVLLVLVYWVCAFILHFALTFLVSVIISPLAVGILSSAPRNGLDSIGPSFFYISAVSDIASAFAYGLVFVAMRLILKFLWSRLVPRPIPAHRFGPAE